MAVISIRLYLNEENGSIKIHNELTNKEIYVDSVSKILKASEIFDLLQYNYGDTYEILSNMEEIKEENYKRFLFEVLDVFNGIKNQINDITVERSETIVDKELNDYEK